MNRFERLTLILTILCTGAAVFGGGLLLWLAALGNAVMFVVGKPTREIPASAFQGITAQFCDCTYKIDLDGICAKCHRPIALPELEQAMAARAAMASRLKGVGEA